MDMPTDHSSPDGPLSPIHHIHSPSPGTQLRAELSAQRHMAALEIPDSQEYSHSKPITPGDVFDNDSLSDVSATGSDAPGTPSPARPSSRDLMPPPPPPNVASRQRSRSPQVSTLVHPAFRGEENLPSRPGSSEPVQGPKGSSRLSPITIGSPEPSGDSCPPRQADVVVAQYPVDDEVPAYESQDGLDEPLAPFDWKDLEQRYHDMINDKEKEFDSVWEEYCQLQDVCLPNKHVSHC